MQIRRIAISVVATVALASAAVAQRSPARLDARGSIAADSTGRRHGRVDRAKLTPEQRAQMRAKRDSVRQARLAAMTPEQRARFEKARAERTRLEGEVKAGRLTQDQARAQFRAWRKANGK
jgi:Spy/CpxP family protein refolding chaperone